MLCTLLNTAPSHTEHARRKTVTALDVVCASSMQLLLTAFDLAHALKRQGKTICVFLCIALPLKTPLRTCTDSEAKQTLGPASAGPQPVPLGTKTSGITTTRALEPANSVLLGTNPACFHANPSGLTTPGEFSHPGAASAHLPPVLLGATNNA